MLFHVALLGFSFQFSSGFIMLFHVLALLGLISFLFQCFIMVFQWVCYYVLDSLGFSLLVGMLFHVFAFHVLAVIRIQLGF